LADAKSCHLGAKVFLVEHVFTSWPVGTTYFMTDRRDLCGTCSYRVGGRNNILYDGPTRSMRNMFNRVGP